MSSTDGSTPVPSRRSQYLREFSSQAKTDFFRIQQYNIETFYRQPLAQYRFGARSGASIVFLGLLKLLLGLFTSEIALAIFNGIPNVLLCVLVVAAGLELVGVGESLNTARARDLGGMGEEGGKGGVVTEDERKRRWAVMFMTAAGILAFRNDAVGFMVGMLCHWSFRAQDWLEERRAGEGRIRLGEQRGVERTV